MKANKASATAYLIAQSTILLSQSPDLSRFIPHRAAELSARFFPISTAFDRVRHWFDKTALNHRMLGGLERLTIPGIKLHYALRKKFLEETVRHAIADQFEQVVVFGAGFDTLAFRLAEEFTEVRFIEVDHPATQGAKITALGQPNSVPENLHFVPLELTGGLSLAALAQGGYCPAARTLFIAEGLLMYFTEIEVATLFAFVREQSGAGSRLAFTFMERRADGRIGFRESSRLVDLWLRVKGEPFKWSLEPDRVPEFLTDQGFDLLDLATPEFFRSHYLNRPELRYLPLAAGEFVCLANVR